MNVPFEFSFFVTKEHQDKIEFTRLFTVRQRNVSLLWYNVHSQRDSNSRLFNHQNVFIFSSSQSATQHSESVPSPQSSRRFRAIGSSGARASSSPRAPAQTSPSTRTTRSTIITAGERKGSSDGQVIIILENFESVSEIQTNKARWLFSSQFWSLLIGRASFLKNLG